jgi:folylpolyglutamate synthase/dihydropteroate synthase
MPEEKKFRSGYRSPINAFNIAVAWRTTALLADTYPCGTEAFSRGIERAAHLYPHTGHFEQIHPEYAWYFDGAHNLEALQALTQMLESYRPLEEWNVVFTLMRDKVTPAVVNMFSDFKKKYYYSLETKRAATFEQVDKHVRCLLPFPADKDSPESFLLDRFQSEFVIFTGSLYFYEQVHNWIHTVRLD